MDSAFYYHNLTDVIPEKEYLALKRNSTKISDSRIKVVYYQEKFFDIGKSTLNINGVKVKIYGKERMLIELIRNRNSIGFDYYKEIIENYREIKDTLNTKNSWIHKWFFNRKSLVWCYYERGVLMNINTIFNNYLASGYSNLNAISKTCQDIILSQISNSSLNKNLTIKGEVVMMALKVIKEV